jgi:hypothetical protein
MAGLNTHGFHPPPCETYQRHHQHRISKSCGNAQPSPLTLEGTECIKLQYYSCSASIPGKGEDLSLQEPSLYFHLQFLELARFPDSPLQHLHRQLALRSEWFPPFATNSLHKNQCKKCHICQNQNSSDTRTVKNTPRFSSSRHLFSFNCYDRVYLTQEWAQTSPHHNPWVSRIKNVALIHCGAKTCVLLQFPSFSCNKENTDDTQPALSELGLHTEKEEIVYTPKTPT